MWSVIGDRITPDGQVGHALSVELEGYEGKPAAWPQDSSDLGEGGCGVGTVLDRVNRHDAVGTGGVEAGLFERSLPEPEHVCRANGPRTLRRALDGDRGKVDSDQSRPRLRRDPQPGPSGSEGEANESPARGRTGPASQ